jgi:HAMP domain-containing protein
MRWPFFHSLRLRMLLLVLLALLPARGLGIYTAWEMRRSARAEALLDAKRIAQIASSSGERLVEGTHQLLAALGRLPEVRTQNAAACSGLFADLLTPYPFYVNLGAAKPTGDIFCSALPFDGVVNVADRTYFREAVAKHEFATGEYQIGRITGKAVIGFGYPVIDDAGRVTAVVFALLDLSWLNRLAAEADLPQGSTLTVLDGDGRVLARHPEPEKWVGKLFQDAAFIQAGVIREQDEGTVEAAGLDGVPRLYAFTALRSGERGKVAHVYVGIPQESAFARVNQIDAWNLAGFGIVLVLASLTMGFGAKWLIFPPLHALVKTTEALAAGDLKARTGLPHGRSELGELACAIDELAEHLEARQSEAKSMREAPN